MNSDLSDMFAYLQHFKFIEEKVGPMSENKPARH